MLLCEIQQVPVFNTWKNGSIGGSGANAPVSFRFSNIYPTATPEQIHSLVQNSGFCWMVFIYRYLSESVHVWMCVCVCIVCMCACICVLCVFVCVSMYRCVANLYVLVLQSFAVLFCYCYFYLYLFNFSRDSYLTIYKRIRFFNQRSNNV